METTKKVLCQLFEDGLMVGTFTLSELADRYKTTPHVPPEPTPAKPVFGHPRTHIGDRSGNDIVRAEGLPYLLEIIMGEADQFIPRGTNLSYVLLPGHTRPSGAISDWSGFAPPASFIRPKGYRKRYFGGKADQAYYQQSDLPDEVPTPTTPPTPDTPSTDTDTPTNANGVPVADPDRDWITDNPDRSPGNLIID